MIMLKTCVTALLGLVLFFGSALSIEAHGATKKKKSDARVSEVKSKNKKTKKNKKSRVAKGKRYKKRSGNGPDLRALTTESPTNAEFTEAPGNGVNPLETKPGL